MINFSVRNSNSFKYSQPNSWKNGLNLNKNYIVVRCASENILDQACGSCCLRDMCICNMKLSIGKKVKNK